MPAITGVINNGSTLLSPASLPVAEKILSVDANGLMHDTIAATDFEAAGTAATAVASEAATRAAADAVLTSAVGAKLDASTVGANSGVAPLDSGGKVPAAYLPSYVDDVVEAANFSSLPGTGETGKIYVTLNDGKIFRWSGLAYVEISASPGSTDAVPEGSTNQYFTAARVRAVVLTGLSLVTNQAIAATDTVLQALGYLGARVNALWSRSISTGTGLSGGGDLSADRTLSLANTAVAAGSYTSANITVDAQGRLTAAANGSSASPGGSSGQVQYNNAGAFGGFSGQTVSASSPNITETAQGTSHTVHLFKGITSFSGKWWDCQDVNAASIANLNSTGKLTLGNQSVDGTAGILELQYKSGSNFYTNTIQISGTSFSLRNNGNASAVIDVGASWISGPLRSQGMCIGATFGNQSTYYVPPTSGLRVEGQSVFGANTDVSGSQVRVVPGAVGTIGQVNQGLASQTANLEEWRKSDQTVYGTVSENGYFTTRKNSAPADAELSASEAAWWFDDTNGAGKLMVKAKTANGTVVTGSITLA